MMRFPHSFARLLWCLALLLAHSAHATCTKAPSTVLNAKIPAAAKMHFGRVNLASARLQPPGTLLASVAVPPTAYTFKGAHADTILWTCDQDDMKDVRFLVSVNADSRYAGWHEMGGDGVPAGVHATWFDYLGLRLSIGDITLGRYWQRVEVPRIAPDETTGKINIRLQHVPTLQAELYRLDQPVPDSGTVHGCPASHRTLPTAIDTSYECTEPAGYIQLAGPGLENWHDHEGGDHRIGPWKFWTGNNGFGYTLYNALSLSNAASCVTRSESAQVRFPRVGVHQLGEASAPFSIKIECDHHTLSGTGSGQTALGLQASPGAWAMARQLKLVNPEGGVDVLVSDQYGSDQGLAKGVGITLHEATGDAKRFFVGQPGLVGSEHPRGSQAGWYPVWQGAHVVTAPTPDSRVWRLDFIARLVPLPGQTLTPGKIHATAQVLVKVQ